MVKDNSWSGYDDQIVHAMAEPTKWAFHWRRWEFNINLTCIHIRFFMVLSFLLFFFWFFFCCLRTTNSFLFAFKTTRKRCSIIVDSIQMWKHSWIFIMQFGLFACSACIPFWISHLSFLLHFIWIAIGFCLSFGWFLYDFMTRGMIYFV